MDEGICDSINGHSFKELPCVGDKALHGSLLATAPLAGAGASAWARYVCCMHAAQGRRRVT